MECIYHFPYDCIFCIVNDSFPTPSLLIVNLKVFLILFYKKVVLVFGISDLAVVWRKDPIFLLVFFFQVNNNSPRIFIEESHLSPPIYNVSLVRSYLHMCGFISFISLLTHILYLDALYLLYLWHDIINLDIWQVIIFQACFFFVSRPF